VSTIKNIQLIDAFEDYDKLASYWFTLHLVMAAKISGLEPDAREKEWNILLRSLGVPIPRKKKITIPVEEIVGKVDESKRPI
jgi:hypothetical protein